MSRWTCTVPRCGAAGESLNPTAAAKAFAAHYDGTHLTAATSMGYGPRQYGGGSVEPERRPTPGMTSRGRRAPASR